MSMEFIAIVWLLIGFITTMIGFYNEGIFRVSDIKLLLLGTIMGNGTLIIAIISHYKKNEDRV